MFLFLRKLSFTFVVYQMGGGEGERGQGTYKKLNAGYDLVLRQARILLKLISTLLRTSQASLANGSDRQQYDNRILNIKNQGLTGGWVVVMVDRVPTFTHSFCV